MCVRANLGNAGLVVPGQLTALSEKSVAWFGFLLPCATGLSLRGVIRKRKMLFREEQGSCHSVTT